MDYKQVGNRTLKQINADNAKMRDGSFSSLPPNYEFNRVKRGLLKEEINQLQEKLRVLPPGQQQERDQIRAKLRSLNTELNKFMYSDDAAPGSVNLSPDALRRRNMAIEWAQEHADDYPNAQQLAQAASTKYDVQVDLIIDQIRNSATRDVAPVDKTLVGTFSVTYTTESMTGSKLLQKTIEFTAKSEADWEKLINRQLPWDAEVTKVTRKS